MFAYCTACSPTGKWLDVSPSCPATQAVEKEEEDEKGAAKKCSKPGGDLRKPKDLCQQYCICLEATRMGTMKKRKRKRNKKRMIPPMERKMDRGESEERTGSDATEEERNTRVDEQGMD